MARAGQRAHMARPKWQGKAGKARQPAWQDPHGKGKPASLRVAAWMFRQRGVYNNKSRPPARAPTPGQHTMPAPSPALAAADEGPSSGARRPSAHTCTTHTKAGLLCKHNTAGRQRGLPRRCDIASRSQQQQSLPLQAPAHIRAAGSAPPLRAVLPRCAHLLPTSTFSLTTASFATSAHSTPSPWRVDTVLFSTTLPSGRHSRSADLIPPLLPDASTTRWKRPSSGVRGSAAGGSLACAPSSGRGSSTVAARPSTRRIFSAWRPRSVTRHCRRGASAARTAAHSRPSLPSPVPPGGPPGGAGVFVSK
eukprot:365684-Chlamydomonas_euryale.AAC.8